MKKSKHFRKDVILARVIAGVVLLVLIVLLILVISFLSKPKEEDKNSEYKPNTQHTQDIFPESQDTEKVEDTQNQIDEDQSENIEPEVDVDLDTEVENKIYVKTTTQVKLRAEANTSCATLDRIDGDTILEVLEVLDGWYKVAYDGKEGYVSATYAKIVEE